MHLIELDTIRIWLIHYGYFVLLPVAVIEGPIITIIAAFLASHGYFSFMLVYAVVVLGDLIGDLLYYAIGRWGKKGFLLRWGHFVGVTPERMETIKAHYQVHSGKTILFGKLTHSAGWVILLGAGVAEMPVGEFIWFNLLGTLPKSLFLMLVGYYLGYAYQAIDSYIAKISLVLLALIIIGGLVYYFRSRTKK